MESHPNLRVLPSNAPTLAESGDIQNSPTEDPGLHTSPQTCPKFNNGLECRVCDLLHACSTCLNDDHNARACKRGVLRVSSGNIGSSELAISSGDCKRAPSVHYGSTVSHTLIKAPDCSTRNAIKLEHRKRQRLAEQRVSDPLSSLPLFYRSELLSPRYIAYRVKSRSKGLNQKWPDHVEEAFQEALRLYPCRGRVKQRLHGKLAGGNEFITAYIHKRTGVFRCRKQVSSHIQVLKKFLGDNEAWMSLVAANGFDVKTGKREGNARHKEVINSGASTSSCSQYTHVTQNQLLSALPPSPVDLSSSNQYSCPSVRRVEFAMILYKGYTTEIIHTYTSIQCDITSAPWPLEDLKGWRTLYPPLAECYEQGQIDCPIFLFDTSLSLMEDLPGCNAILSIESSLDMAQGANYRNWQSFTRFYEEHGHFVDLAKFYKGSKFGDALRPFEVFPGRRPTDCTLRGLPLKSDWWAKTFSNIIGQNRKARATKDAKAIRIENENTERYIQGISVMQVIYASSHTPGSKLERVAILVWRFSTSRKGEVATTTWRRLIPPLSPFQVQSPLPPQPQALLTLDTTLQNSMVQRSAPPYADFYTPQQQQSMFADNSEEPLDAGLSDGSSRRTTPPSDLISFPSSTSSSFPPNFSHSDHPLSLGQESSFQYQDSVYGSLGSFSSQGSQYHTQDLVMPTHDVYPSQSEFYQTQDTLYQYQGHTQMYDLPTPQTLLPEDPTAAACHDFTGGEIQITYPVMHEIDQNSLFPPPQQPPPSVYEPHLFAPRATLLPQHQHQLIQHPEQFDERDYNIEPEERVGEIAEEGGTEENEQQCEIDWQLITEQPVQVVPDPRLQEPGMEGADSGGEHRFEELGDKGFPGEQGYVLGEVMEEEGSAVVEK